MTEPWLDQAQMDSAYRSARYALKKKFFVNTTFYFSIP